MPKLLSKKVIDKIILLRQRGYSISEIRKIVKVGQGTVFRYIQGVDILPQYNDIWLSKRWSSVKRMKIAENKAMEKVKKRIKTLSEIEKTIFLSALYWGEGNKKDFGLTNSDPDLIKVFILGLRNIFKITTDRLRLSIRIYKDLDKEKCLNFWSKITGVPVEKFVSVNVLEGKKQGKLSYGMCRIRVTKGGDLLKYINAVNKRIIELFVNK